MDVMDDWYQIICDDKVVMGAPVSIAMERP